MFMLSLVIELTGYTYVQVIAPAVEELSLVVELTGHTYVQVIAPAVDEFARNLYSNFVESLRQ